MRDRQQYEYAPAPKLDFLAAGRNYEVGLVPISTQDAQVDLDARVARLQAAGHFVDLSDPQAGHEGKGETEYEIAMDLR